MSTSSKLGNYEIRLRHFKQQRNLKNSKILYEDTVSCDISRFYDYYYIILKKTSPQEIKTKKY